MGKRITNEVFRESIAAYVEVLRKAYIDKVEKAEDREYAESYYQSLLFLNNEMVPYPTVLFNELLVTYRHHQRLFGSDNAYEKTIELVPEIRKIAENNLNNAKQYLLGRTQSPVSPLYVEQIENDREQLTDLVHIEERVLQFTDENLSGVLAIHLAGQQLYEEYRNPEVKEESSKGQYTLNERLLALSILLESLGFRQGLNEDRTTLAALYHLVMDKTFNDSTKIKNSNIYKSLGMIPKVVNDPTKLKSYLQNIRPFFEKANMIKALELIDQRIESCNQ